MKNSSSPHKNRPLLVLIVVFIALLIIMCCYANAIQNDLPDIFTYCFLAILIIDAIGILIYCFVEYVVRGRYTEKTGRDGIDDKEKALDEKSFFDKIHIRLTYKRKNQTPDVEEISLDFGEKDERNKE